MILTAGRSMPASVLLLLIERIGYLFAAVEGADEDKQGTTSDNEAEGARRLVALVI